MGQVHSWRHPANRSWAGERGRLQLPHFRRSVKFFGENAYDAGNSSLRRHSKRFQGLWATLSYVCLAKTDLKSNNMHMRDPGILFLKSPYITVLKSAIWLLFSFPISNQSNKDKTIKVNEDQEFCFWGGYDKGRFELLRKGFVRGRINRFFHTFLILPGFRSRSYSMRGLKITIFGMIRVS